MKQLVLAATLLAASTATWANDNTIDCVCYWTIMAKGVVELDMGTENLTRALMAGTRYMNIAKAEGHNIDDLAALEVEVDKFYALGDNALAVKMAELGIRCPEYPLTVKK